MQILSCIQRNCKILNLIRVTKCLIKTYFTLLVIEFLKLSIICKISRATTFIKFIKYVQNADFELYIEKLQKIKSGQNYKMLNYNLSTCYRTLKIKYYM